MTDNAKRPKLTTTAGSPWPSNNDSLVAGPRGPLLQQDYQLVEKLAHQNRERIPERTVHAKGVGAHGTLTITGDITKYTKAKVFKKGAQTPMLARFSTVAGEMGAADAERDVRGFSLKFYTEEGNWDIVGNNTPIFFVRDGYKFPDFIHTQKRHPRTHLRSNTAMWDFWSLSPESFHQVTYLMGDRGLPIDPMHMSGYGSHTYSFWNDAGERYWVKFHFITAQGWKFWTNEEAAQIVARTRESSQEALYGAIENKKFPRWNFKIQIMPEKEAEKMPFDPFDLTKVWSHRDYPLMDVGYFELNRNPDDYFAEIEQAAFSPSNIVPGISWSPDKMLQARVFSYADAHRYRLGGNYDHIPVNQPKCPVANYHRDGQMNTFGGNELAGHVDAFYEPNSFDGPFEDKTAQEPPLRISGEAARYNHQGKGDDDYFQVRDLFNVFNDDEKQRLYSNMADAMKGVPDFIIERQLGHCAKVDKAYEAGVRAALKEKYNFGGKRTDI